MAPSSMDRSGSRTTSSGSTSNRVPRPSQLGQAPYGELKLKLRGASSSNDRPQVGQARCWLKVRVSSSSGGSSVPGHQLHLGHPLGQTQRRLQRVGQPPLDPLPLDQAVDDHLDGVDLVAGQLRRVRQLVDLAVDAGPGEPLPGQLLQQALVLALAAPHDRGQHLEAGAVGQLQDPVHDLLRGLALHHGAVPGAVRHPHPGVQQPQVVVDLGDGPDRRAGVAGRRLLVDGDGRRQALDEVHVGLVHLAEELPGVAGQRLHVASLPLGVDGVEGQRALARAGQPGEDDQPVARQVQRDVAEVVLAGPANHQLAAVRPETRWSLAHLPVWLADLWLPPPSPAPPQGTSEQTFDCALTRRRRSSTTWV